MTKSGTNLTIREFRPSDYDAVIKLWNESGLPYRGQGRDSRERIEMEIKQSTTFFLVAETDGKIIGTALGTHDGRKGWINRVAVAKHYRRSGLARRLVTEIEHWFDRIGIDVTACLIEADNHTSMKAFEKLGYEKWDGFYFSKRKNREA